MPKAKYVRESHTTMTEMVLPNDTNTLSNLMGGNLMRLVDIAGAICAQKHSNRIVVTASVDHVSFVNPIPLGNVVTLEAQVTRAFNTSMEVVVDVYSENIPAGIKNKTNQAFLTFVAVDQSGRPIEVSEAIPETEDEKVQYERALHRRQLRLLMAGRLNAQDTEELKKTFFPAPSNL
jgi:acyl-CoA hydrolase